MLLKPLHLANKNFSILLYRTHTLSNHIRLHVTIVVLASPHKPAIRLEGLGHHVINKSVLVPDTTLLKILHVVPEMTMCLFDYVIEN